MITAWRIVRSDYSESAMDGEGAFRYGGRWNSPGTRMVYLSETRALAALEVIAHVDRMLLSIPYAVISVQFDDTLVQDILDFPVNWNDPLIPESTQLIGDDWMKSKTSLVLRVPSVMVLGEWNHLVNPAHPLVDELQIGSPESFRFDSRL